MHNMPKLVVDLGTPCPVCKIPGAVFKNGVICKCFSCALEELKAGKKDAVAHLPAFWISDPEVEKMAAKLVSRHHPEAATASICYMMRKKHGSKNGAIVLGKCHKVSPRDKILHGYDYLIILAWDMWMMFNDIEKEALLLHELLHVFKDEKGENPAWKIEPHNVEEFSKVIEVYGLWKPDLQAFAKAIYARQEPDGNYTQLGFAGPARQARAAACQTTH
ncbi:MAG: putative metallopeptidase [Syntrophobacter sp.]